MIKLKNQILAFCAVFCVLSGQAFAQTITCANRAEVAQVGALCLGCGVTNPDNAADCDLATAATITANPILMGGVTFDLFFDGFSGTAGDTVEIFVADISSADLAGTLINSFGDDGTGTVQQNGDQKPLSQTTIVQAGANFKITFYPQADYEGIRLNANAANAGGGATVSYDILKAQVVQNSPMVFTPRCETPNVATSSFGGSCNATFCSIQNPNAITTPSESDFATLTVNAGLVGGTTEVTGFWNQLACDQDSARIVLSSNGGQPSGTVTINAIQKPNPGAAGTVVASITVPALGSQPAEFFIFPGTPFNAVQVEVEGGLGFSNSSVRVYAICLNRVFPPRPVSRMEEVCVNDSATLKTIPYNQETARWYTQRTGGSPVFTGDTFVTGPLTTDTTFYYDGFIVGSNGCVSSFRDSIQVEVTNLAPKAAGVQGTQIACFNEPFTVAPFPEGNIFTFYPDSSFNNPLITSTSFTFQNVTSDTVVWVQNTRNGRCGSDTLVKVSVRLFREPVSAQVFDTIGICLDSNNNPINPLLSVYVIGELPQGFNTTYRVYNRSMQLIGVGGGNPAEFQFPDSVLLPVSQFAINGPGFVDSIFVDAVSGDCYESRNKQKIVLIGVRPSTNNAQVDDVIACEGSTATLTVNNVEPFLKYRWFDAEFGGNLIDTGITINYLVGSTVDTLYVEGDFGNGCGTPTRSQVIITPLLETGFEQSDLFVTTCFDSVAVFNLGAVDFGSGQVSWYDSPQGGFPIFTGDTFVTPPLAARDTFYFEVSNLQCSGNRLLAVADLVAPPTVSIDDPLRYACLGDQVMLSAVVSNTQADVVWTNNPVFGAGVILSTDNPFNYQTGFTGPAQVEQVYAHAAIDQCRSTDKFLVRIENISSRQNPIVNPTQASICENQSTQFDIVPQLNQSLVSYSWWDAAAGGNQLSNTVSFSTPNLSSSTSYFAQLELEDENVCLSRGRTEVSVDVLPRLSAPDLNDNCVADENSVTYSWPAISGAVTYEIVINITRPDGSLEVRNLSTTNTTVVVDNLLPNSVVEFNIRSLGTLPCQTSPSTFKTCVSNACGLSDLSPAEPFYLVCENEAITVAITGVPDNAGVTVGGNPANNVGGGRYEAQVTATDISGTLPVNQDIIFTVSQPNVAGCDPVDIRVTLRVEPTPEGRITVEALDPAIIGGRVNSFRFIADFVGGDKTWFWTFGDGNSSTEKNPVHEYEEDGTYTVTLVVNEAAGACPATASLEITVSSIPDLFVPNTFTPNGDGKNDEWRVFGRNLDNERYSAKIFNSYGNVIFESTRLEQGWDGTYEGEPVKMGSYYFQVIVFDEIGQRLEREGTLNLIRK